MVSQDALQVVSQHALQQRGSAWSGGGVCSQGGLLQGGPHQEGGCLVETPPMATAAGGMHPTGIHSCILINCVKRSKFQRKHISEIP